MLGHLGLSWGLLGAILGHLGAILGPSWTHLGPSGGNLGPSWGQDAIWLGPEPIFERPPTRFGGGLARDTGGVQVPPKTIGPNIKIEPSPTTSPKNRVVRATSAPQKCTRVAFDLEPITYDEIVGI